MGILVTIIEEILKTIFILVSFFAIIVLVPNVPPYTKFTSIEIEPTQQWTGPLAPNTYLNNVQRLYEDKLLGPEAFQIWNGEVYTGLATGEIVKVSLGGHVTFVTKIGQPCTDVVREHICGRPLGFVIDEKNKLLYVADANHGIWKVDLVTDKKQLLVSPEVPIDGRTPKIFNSVALYKNGDLFWTDSSSDFSLKDGLYTLLADPSGRLLHYNAAKNESKVLLDNLWFANGVVVSPDNQFVIVSETSMYRIVKYYIDGSKKGTSEVFVAGLPGIPDNIRSLPDGSGVLVSLYNVFDDDHPLLTKTMAATPLVRKFLARLVHFHDILVEMYNSKLSNYIFGEIFHSLSSFESLSKFSSGMSGLVQLDWNGSIVAAYYNTDGSIKHISDAIVFNDKLYTGSPHIQNFIGAVSAPPLLKKAFSANQVPKVNKPVEQNKPEIKVNDKPKQTPQQTQPPVAKQPENLQKEPVKQNAVPKDKTKISSKEAEIKTNEIPKTAEVKTKTAEKEQKQKETVSKAQPASKETETKSKVVPKAQQKLKEPEGQTVPKVQQEPKVVAKPNVPKVNAKPSTPKVDAKSSAPKVDAKSSTPKVDAKSSTPKVDAKPNEPKVETKPVSKESEPKAKTKEAEIKLKTPKESKEPKNANVDKSKEKVKNSEKPNVKNTKPKKEIPIEEIIPSDTAKPSNEKLKVIKKSGPQEIPNPNL